MSGVGILLCQNLSEQKKWVSIEPAEVAAHDVTAAFSDATASRTRPAAAGVAIVHRLARRGSVLRNG